MEEDDDWQDLINLEEQFEERGFEEGMKDGERAGVLEGREMGAEYGYGFGKEISKYKMWATTWLKVGEVHPKKLSERSMRQLKQLVTLCEAVPECNEENSHIEDKVKAVRTRYKAVSASISSRHSSPGAAAAVPSPSDVGSDASGDSRSLAPPFPSLSYGGDLDGDLEDLQEGILIALGILGGILAVLCLGLLVYFCVQNASRLRTASLEEVELSDEHVRRLLPDENALDNYVMAREFERRHPHGSVDTRITPEQEVEIYEKGVNAWEFVVSIDVNALLQSKTDVLFMGSENCVQTNLPIPRVNPVYYFEVKITEKPADVNMWVGLATKPYPPWRMVGWNRYSVGYSVNNGVVNKNYQFTSLPVGEQCFVGDIVGVGFQPHSGYVWFTRNGRKFRTVLSGLEFDMFPTVSADGPCSFSANFGQRGFVYIEANVRRWGLAPIEGAQSPPPMYGMDENTILLETGISYNHRPPLQSSAPRTEQSRLPGMTEETNEGVRGEQPSTDYRHSHRHFQQQHGEYPSPPAYAEEDPIAKELLEAGTTELFDQQLHRDRYGKRAQSADSTHVENYRSRVSFADNEEDGREESDDDNGGGGGDESRALLGSYTHATAKSSGSGVASVSDSEGGQRNSAHRGY
ncbi:Protein ssh4 [Spiromyces aspiralis]|uniref:Protein ssh4 n=1 Tax=Spiromyces aspiralis TaxID=68401 RepID=A0ACC1HI43_9FUNG|nr:Protein ssh4 [Spiromyces aspiralis]